MPPGFLGKTALALVWIVPAVALFAFAADKVIKDINPPPPPKLEVLKVPIEVINANEKSKIVYIEFESQAVPEPSSLLLLPLSAMVLLRRRR